MIATLLDPRGAVSLWQRSHNLGWRHPAGSIGAPTGLYYRSDSAPRLGGFYRHALGLTDPSVRLVADEVDEAQPEWKVSLAVASIVRVASDVADAGGENLADVSTRERLSFLVEKVPG